MSSFIDIEPVALPVKYISKVKIDLVSLTLGVSAIFNVILYDENNKMIEFKQFKIEDIEYSNWSEDDTYIENLLLEKAGYIRI
jgi:hypothetical protein